MFLLSTKKVSQLEMWNCNNWQLGYLMQHSVVFSTFYNIFPNTWDGTSIYNRLNERSAVAWRCLYRLYWHSCNFRERVGRTRAQNEIQNPTALRHTSLTPLPQIPTREPNERLFFFLPLYVVMAEAAIKTKHEVHQKQSAWAITVGNALCSFNVDCIASFWGHLTQSSIPVEPGRAARASPRRESSLWQYMRAFDKRYPTNSAEGSSHILGRLQCCMWNVFITGTLAYISACHYEYSVMTISNVKRSRRSCLKASVYRFT